MRRYRTLAVTGTIRSRLLVNAVVDPEEAALRLPDGLNSRVVDGGTVVGCCLLDLARVRPSGLPVPGVHIRAAAHRIAVEWADPDGGTVVGVYVPARLTDSRLAQVIGGRLFPGVHRPASIAAATEGKRLDWSVTPASSTDFGVRVIAHVSSQEFDPCDAVGATCLSATVGLSPGRDNELEAARMDSSHRQAQPVDIEALDSSFLASFASARPAQSYLIRDVDVSWSAYRAPGFGRAGAR